MKSLYIYLKKAQWWLTALKWRFVACGPWHFGIVCFGSAAGSHRKDQEGSEGLAYPTSEEGLLDNGNQRPFAMTKPQWTSELAGKEQWSFCPQQAIDSRGRAGWEGPQHTLLGNFLLLGNGSIPQFLGLCLWRVVQWPSPKKDASLNSRKDGAGHCLTAHISRLCQRLESDGEAPCAFWLGRSVYTMTCGGVSLCRRPYVPVRGYKR